ncbi:MAG: hypothetical protein NT018_06905 [Armatimonadetes bacterium]|nr:hypothetical protein [Armatimonadota bacterium]
MKTKALLIVTMLMLAIAACALAPKPAAKPGKPMLKPPPKQAQKQVSTHVGPGGPRHGGFPMLNLTAAQKTKMEAIRKADRKTMQAIMSNSKLSEDAKRQKMMDLRKQSRTKMNAILTPAQKKKLEEMRKQRPEFGKGPGPGSKTYVGPKPKK